MATHSSILAWRIPGMGEPGALLSVGSHRVGHDWSNLAAAATAAAGAQYDWCLWQLKQERVWKRSLRCNCEGTHISGSVWTFSHQWLRACNGLASGFYLFCRVFLNLFILFLVVLGLHCCPQTFSSASHIEVKEEPGSSGSKQGLLFIVVYRLLLVVASLAVCRLWGTQASVVMVHGLSCFTAVGSSWSRNWTCGPCIGRQILNHWTTRKSQPPVFSLKFLMYGFYEFILWDSYCMIFIRFGSWNRNTL